MCGCLLHGYTGGNSIANTCYGPPVSRDGRILVNAAGEPETDAQPPFLLRYSPQLFAKESKPQIFKWRVCNACAGVYFID